MPERVVMDWDGTATETDVLHLVLLEFGDEKVYEEHEARLLVQAELSADPGHVAVARVLTVLEHAFARIGFVLCVGCVEGIVLRRDPVARLGNLRHAEACAHPGRRQTGAGR